ncbi:MAG TPA: RNHCP domain-containing protein [Thermomicrobiales bacterium]
MASSAKFYDATTDDYTDDPRACATDNDSVGDRWPLRKANRERRGRDAVPRGKEPTSPRTRDHTDTRRGPTRAARQGTEEFRCRHCRAFVGPTVGGGRHRNHCPACLHSRHVDERRPGDRASDCRATMAPVARFDRPGGEPVIVHRCYGCGLERHNRLAADDTIALLTRLPLVAPRLGRRDSGAPADAVSDGEPIWDDRFRRKIS